MHAKLQKLAGGSALYILKLVRLLWKSFGFQQLAFNILKICFVLMEIGNGILVANRKSLLNIVLNLIWIYILQKYFRTVHSLQKQEMPAKSMQLHWNCITRLHLCQKQLFSFFLPGTFLFVEKFPERFLCNEKNKFSLVQAIYFYNLWIPFN